LVQLYGAAYDTAMMDVKLWPLICLVAALLAHASPFAEASDDNLLSARAPNAATGHVIAIGIGVSDLGTAKKFWNLFGYRTCIRGNFETWSEDICMGASGPSFIPMKFKATTESPERSVKNLPVKITFHVPDPKALASRAVKAGGAIVDKPTAAAAGVKDGTVFVKDPEGYLLELVPGGAAISLTSVAYGSSNMTHSAVFFGKLFGTSAEAPKKVEAWDIVTVPTKRAFSVQFLDFHDGRSTKHLPLKIVIATSDMAGFKSAITTNGGTIPKGGGSALGGAAAFGNDPVDQILIEINRG